MHFPILTLFITLITLVAGVLSTSSKKCLTTTCSEAQQRAAIEDFADLFLVKRDIQKAFDLYILGEYINHNPGATSGRQAALDILKPFLADPTVKFKLAPGPGSVFAGEGFGILHYKLSLPGVNLAVMDRYRFKGTCIVEHWDVAQQITGNETNPIAFF